MQNKKMKILIVSHAMELGGAEMALLGLLEHLDTLTLTVNHHQTTFITVIGRFECHKILRQFEFKLR